MERAYEVAATSGRGAEAYLDNAATAPMHPRVIEVVSAVMRDAYGNPSSQHAKGRAARALLDESRAAVADAVGAFPDEIYFTSGGTEANNLAITGSCSAYAREHGRPGAVVASALEHPSVTKTVRGLKRDGWTVFYLDARDGELDLAGLDRALDEVPDVVLATVMSVQSELGYRFPIENVVGSCRAVGCARRARGPLVHTDAVQAFGKLPLDVHELDVDLLSFCAHKVGGPKGVGALYVRRGTQLFTTAFGGGQERGLRSGTEALPLIAGFAEAARIAHAEQAAAFERASALRAHAVGALRRRHADIVVNSRDDGSPFIVNFSLPGTDNRAVLASLSDADVYLSASMACSSNHTTVPPGTWREKHPLALQLAGVPASLTRCTYRLSFSDRTTVAEVDRFLGELEEVVPAELVARSA